VLSIYIVDKGICRSTVYRKHIVEVPWRQYLSQCQYWEVIVAGRKALRIAKELYKHYENAPQCYFIHTLHILFKNMIQYSMSIIEVGARI
jgi:hypothetical protein